MSNVLGLSDQTFFVGEQAIGATALMQGVWVYDRTIDIDGLRRFHHDLQQGRLSRRIERSPLPFGRHRWVLPSGHSGLEIVATPRPREEFGAWLNVQAATTLDAEHGPEWHLAVLPFTDGGAGVSLIISHCLTDGVGLCEALADAASSRHDPISWPVAESRPRWRALREDARQTACDIPDIGRAVVAAARLALRNRGRSASASPPPMPPANADEPLTLPAATIFIDTDEWDARAQSLGGTSNTLLAGLAARLAHHMGRVTAGGSVTLTLPVNERTTGDHRANAITNVNITVDPPAATTDLRVIRAATKQALIRRAAVPDAQTAMLPLVPLLPQWLVRRMVGVAAGSDTRVDSSNLGVVNPAACCADGTGADDFAIRNLARGVTPAIMRQAGGMLSVLSGRVHRRVFVSVLAYQPGRCNSNNEVQKGLSNALREFSLTATTGWGSPERVGGAQ